MRVRLTALLFILVALLLGAGQASATTSYSALYGDNDGFGIGAYSGTLNPDVSHASGGEAPYTDVRLIGQGYIAPPFAPTGGFSTFSIPTSQFIVSATLTMRTGAWVAQGGNRCDGKSNAIVLDGQAVPSSFLQQFPGSGNTYAGIDTQSISLPSSFFDDLADGNVSLNGSYLSEYSGAGSFQVDYLQLDIETAPGLPAVALIGAAPLIGGIVRRFRKR
jgi:hypothetical protein